MPTYQPFVHRLIPTLAVSYGFMPERRGDYAFVLPSMPGVHVGV